MLRSVAARCLGSRSLHTSQVLRIDPKNVEEVKIPVPWGHIAGKWWGDQKVRPVLAIHGISDNCGTFDALMPLTEAPSVLAIDLPGHGYSSHIAAGLANNFPHVVLCLRYLVNKHFAWPKVDLLGHSFGSCLFFLYSSLFPKSVGKFISIDCARFNMGVKGSTSPELLQLAAHSSLAQLDEGRSEKTYDEHLKDFLEFRKQSGYGLTEKAARLLLARSLAKTSSGMYVETQDPRLPVYLGIPPVTTLDDIASRITCEMLTIRFTSGVFQKGRKLAYDQQLDIMRKSASNLVAVDVIGGHHGHLEAPESVASHINRFLKGA